MSASPEQAVEVAPRPPGDVRRIRRPIPVLWFPLVLAGAAVYGVLAFLNPILGRSPLGVVLLSALVALTTGVILMSPNADRMDALRVHSVFHLVCFCLTPLAVTEAFWHFQHPIPGLVASASAFALAAYVATAFGYHFPLFASLPDRVDLRARPINTTIMGISAVALLGIGGLCFVVMFIWAGGFGRILGGAESRVEFFEGFGYLFWATLLLYPGGLLFYVANSRRMVSRWMAAVPLMGTFGAMLVLQGRGRALNALLLLIIASHYVVRPVRMGLLALFGLGAFVLVVFVGVARDADVRFLLLEDPSVLIVEVYGRFVDYAQGTLGGNFARIRQLMLIFDKVPGWQPHDWGISLFQFLNPPLRLLGFDALQVPSIGPRLFVLAHPGLPVDLRTGYLPSLIGEFLWNFPWYLALVPCLLYGMLLRQFYNRLILANPDLGSIALYTVLMFYFNNMVHSAMAQFLFEIFVLTLPVFVVALISRKALPLARFEGVAASAVPAATPPASRPEPARSAGVPRD